MISFVMRLARRPVGCPAIFAFGLLLAGCGGRNVELVAVQGRVLLDGQPPPGGGTIYFAPIEAADGLPLRPGWAYFSTDGYYRAGSFDAGGDGLIPGKYRVGIHCWEIEPTIDGPPAKSFIPSRYTMAGTSGLVLLVESRTRRMTWNAELISP